MINKKHSMHRPAGDVFDSGRLSPPEAAKSLAVWKNYIKDRFDSLMRKDLQPFATRSDLQIVCLLEKRSPYLDFVILNCCEMLGEGWGFQLVTRPDLVNWIGKQTRALPKVKIFPVIDNEMTANKLKRNTDFWEKITGETLLLIDADTILCHSSINNFLEYDYVAGLWRKEDVSPWCRFGGGVSLRRKSIMMKIYRECNNNPRLIPDESIFISMMLKLQAGDYHLPDNSVASKFSVERCYYKQPFALHKAWQFIHYQQLSEILENTTMPGQHK